MNDHTSFKRVAAISAIVSAPVALASWILVSIAVEFNFDLVSDLADILTLGATAAGPFQLAWVIADTFGYTLLLAPAALYLWHWLKPQNPNLVTLYTFFGFAYILVGAVGVALLGGAVPPMMRAYVEASEPERDVLLIAFHAIFDMAFYGVGPLSWLLGGLWWLGIGVVLREDRRILGTITVVLGVISLGVWAEQVFRFESLVILETFILLLEPIWALWLGIVIARRSELSEPSLETAMAT